jgi:hypothetical protein
MTYSSRSVSSMLERTYLASTAAGPSASASTGITMLRGPSQPLDGSMCRVAVNARTRNAAVR